MTGGAPQTRLVNGGEHLLLLRSLAAELERAMQAIASNNLRELEESVASQQELSGRLAQLASELRNAPAAGNAPAAACNASAADSSASSLMIEIREAAAELQRLNLRYSYLLQYSSRSVALMASLFNSFRGQIKEASGARLKVQTWSCQM